MIPRHKSRDKRYHDRQNHSKQTQYKQQPKGLVEFFPNVIGIVKIESVRKHQDDAGDAKYSQVPTFDDQFIVELQRALYGQ